MWQDWEGDRRWRIGGRRGVGGGKRRKGRLCNYIMFADPV